MRAKADDLQDVPAPERGKNRAVCRKEVRQALSDLVNIENLGREIAMALAEYDQEIADKTKDCVDKVSKEGVNELKKSSPKLTGGYRRGWQKREAYRDTRTKRNIVHNQTDYQLTHLLEHGHASRYGGRVKPKVHIKPVEESMIESLETKIEEAVKG